MKRSWSKLKFYNFSSLYYEKSLELTEFIPNAQQVD